MIGCIEHIPKGDQPDFDKLCHEQMMGPYGMHEVEEEEEPYDMYDELPFIRAGKSWHGRKMNKTDERAAKDKGLVKEYARKRHKRGDWKNYARHDCYA